MVQNIYSEMHLVSCTNTHCEVTDLVYHKMIKSIKTSIPWEWNTTFLWNKKILGLCLRWYILKSCCFVAEVTFKCSGNIMLYQFHDRPMKHIPKHKSNHQFNCSLFNNLEKVLKTMYRENHWYLLISLEYLKMEWLTKFHSSEQRMQEHLFMPCLCLCLSLSHLPGSSKISLMMFPYHSKTKLTLQILPDVKFVVVNIYYCGKHLWTIGMEFFFLNWFLEKTFVHSLFYCPRFLFYYFLLLLLFYCYCCCACYF